MKLAEALLERKNLLEDIEIASRKLSISMKKDLNDTSEDTEVIATYAQLLKLYGDLEAIINKINIINSKEFEGVTNIELLNRRKVLAHKLSSIKALYSSMQGSLKDREFDLDGKVIMVQKRLVLDKSDMSKLQSSISKELRELEVKIQSRNWIMDI